MSCPLQKGILIKTRGGPENYKLYSGHGRATDRPCSLFCVWRRHIRFWCSCLVLCVSTSPSWQVLFGGWWNLIKFKQQVSEVLSQWCDWTNLHVLGDSQLCVYLYNPVLSHKLVAWNRPQKEYWHHENWQSLQIRASCPACLGVPLSWALLLGMNGQVGTEEFTLTWVELPFVYNQHH